MRPLTTHLLQRLTLASVRRAYERARRGKTNRPEVIFFSDNLTKNLLAIVDEISQSDYKAGKYRRFTIYEPKVRQILALPFRDRIVHQWLVEEFIKPYYIPRFTRDSYACIPGRGTHAAVRRVQRNMRSAQQYYGPSYYILKMDIAKFFYSINTTVLLEIIAKSITQPTLLTLIKTIVQSSPNGSGLPIGSYTSQYFANIYMNELDQYLKRTVKIKYYVRYMDDFIIFVPNKQAARVVYGHVELFLQTRLQLALNPKSRYFPACHGVDFCGYKIHPNHMTIRKKSKKHIRNIIFDFESGIDSQARFEMRVNSWLGHVLHANSFAYCQRQLSAYLPLFPKLKTIALAAAPDSRLVVYQKDAASCDICLCQKPKVRLSTKRTQL